MECDYMYNGEYIVVEKKSGRIPYDKVYKGKGHAKKAIESNRATFPDDELTVLHLEPKTIKRLIEELNGGV